MNGLLSVDRELGRLLSEAAARGDSGVVTGIRGKLKRLFCLANGWLVFAASNVIEEQIAYRLLQEKLLATQDLRIQQEACSRQKELQLSRFLVEFDILSNEQMEPVVHGHVKQLLFSTLDWTDGQCSFERGKPDLDGEFTVRANSVALMLEYARSRPQSIDAARMRIGPPNVRPIATSNAEQLLAEITHDRQSLYLMEHCNGDRTLGRLVEDSPHEPETTWRAIYGLVLSGALAPQGAKSDAASSEDVVSRDEFEARLDRARDATHYGVLELSPTAKPVEVRNAYYFLARRYHPDRLRSGALHDLLDQIESYFAQVTEAYNTLSDLTLRRAYDDELASTTQPQKAEQNTRELAQQNYMLARSLIERGRFTDAVTSLENAIALDDTQAKFYLELGRLQARNPRHRESAEKNLIHANEIDPALAEAYYSLGDMYARTSREEDAARLFREVLRWEPGHIGAAEKLEELGQSPSGDGGGLRGLFRG